jgi:phosphoribosyl-ATP pyrophosphohydrolase/phosphoribosyl-AMP cyclohydrolase/histidinol dehydrogenase
MRLRRIALSEVPAHLSPGVVVEPETLTRAGEIVDAVRRGRFAAVTKLARQFDGEPPEGRWIFTLADCASAWDRLDANDRELLQRAADRIRRFAQRQMDGLRDWQLDVDGVQMGMTWHPLSSAGCYVPGGRYPLVSSLLMTAVTARVAGVKTLWVASPARCDVMLAAAHLVNVDGYLAVGGAHAIAALAYGAEPVPAADVVVGPGNRWVTAAKQCVSSVVKVDLLAGPSELLVLADEAANPAWIASDLLAQAEHDADARPMLIATSDDMIDAVERELERQLRDLPTADTATAALRNGFAVPVATIDQAIEASELIAPEHLALHVAAASRLRHRFARCGSLFVGGLAAEVLGDYGAGPNHVLPTAGTARFASGLSVLTFLRTQTWLSVVDQERANPLIEDAERLAKLEGLEAHARSATARKLPHWASMRRTV